MQNGETGAEIAVTWTVLKFAFEISLKMAFFCPNDSQCCPCLSRQIRGKPKLLKICIVMKRIWAFKNMGPSVSTYSTIHSDQSLTSFFFFSLSQTFGAEFPYITPDALELTMWIRLV